MMIWGLLNTLFCELIFNHYQFYIVLFIYFLLIGDIYYKLKPFFSFPVCHQPLFFLMTFWIL